MLKPLIIAFHLSPCSKIMLPPFFMGKATIKNILPTGKATNTNRGEMYRFLPRMMMLFNTKVP
jgi:hypothetical protein